MREVNKISKEKYSNKKYTNVLVPIQDMFFDNIHDLYIKCGYIRDKISTLDRDYKDIYKWYYFTKLSLLRESDHNPIKSTFWEYINSSEYVNKNMVTATYLTFCRMQRKLKNKYAKEQSKED